MRTLTQNDISHVLDLINTIRLNTTPIGDSEANKSIADCWNELGEVVAIMKKEVEASWSHQKYLSEVLNSGDGVYRP